MIKKYIEEKLFKAELTKEKVELARKPQSILNEAKKLDSKMRTQESKMSKAYQNYKSSQKEFVNFMDDAIKQASGLNSDIGRVMDAASDLGITDFSSIKGLSEANDLLFKLEDIAKNAKKLYPSIG
jgi:hydrogenase maturation factor HypF (carbamoyltransferase family)